MPPSDLAGVPAPTVGMIATHLSIVEDQDRARRFCADALDAMVVRLRGSVVLPLAGALLILSGRPIDRGPEADCLLWDPDGHLIELGQSLSPPDQRRLHDGYGHVRLRDRRTPRRYG